MISRGGPYAFRYWSEPQQFWPELGSSAEWPEDLALELGDRVSEGWFAEVMAQAYLGDLFLVTVER